jgi:hypothetical protein
VIHERGSPETIRDPRGFAVKFYTREGNQDLVGTLLPGGGLFEHDNLEHLVEFS